jgi:hypothetical protein
LTYLTLAHIFNSCCKLGLNKTLKVALGGIPRHSKDGKIIEAKEEANVLGMMLQLGMELKPKEVKK